MGAVGAAKEGRIAISVRECGATAMSIEPDEETRQQVIEHEIDTAAIRDAHTRGEVVIGEGYCRRDKLPWPCDAIRLADALDRQQEELDAKNAELTQLRYVAEKTLNSYHQALNRLDETKEHTVSQCFCSKPAYKAYWPISVYAIDEDSYWMICGMCERKWSVPR